MAKRHTQPYILSLDIGLKEGILAVVELLSHCSCSRWICIGVHRKWPIYRCILGMLLRVEPQVSPVPKPR